MATPAQMFDHALNPVKGALVGQPWTVDKTLNIDSSVTNASAATTIYAGSVIYQDRTSNGWKIGIPTYSTTLLPIPFLAFQNSSDFDVLGDSGNMVGASTSSMGSQVGRLGGISCAQHSEVETTQYDTGVSAASWTAGLPLIGKSDGTVTTYGGSVAPTVVLGVCSDGLITSEQKRSAKVLRFHTCYVPRFS